jgi:hypothetical protein
MSEGRWDAKAVADRLEEAAQTLRRLPSVRVRGYVSSWPPIIRDFWEAYGRHEAEVRLGSPPPYAITARTRSGWSSCGLRVAREEHRPAGSR